MKFLFRLSEVNTVFALILAYTFTLDAPTATIIVGVLVCISSCWQTYTLSKVHTLVNSNFTEAKAARVAAESALKTSQDLNANLQKQLDARPAIVHTEVKP